MKDKKNQPLSVNVPKSKEKAEEQKPIKQEPVRTVIVDEAYQEA